MDTIARSASWRSWLQYTASLNTDPWLTYSTRVEQQLLLLGFAARTRTGCFGAKREVGHQTVEKAIRHVAQTLVLAGRPDPRRPLHGGTDLDLPFTRLLKYYRDHDPAPRPLFAIPVFTVRAAAHLALVSPDPLAQATADLIVIAFFYLLRVGEYTTPDHPARPTRTVPLRRQDIRFWRLDHSPIAHSSPLTELLAAHSATIHLDNQKNGDRRATVHQNSCPTDAIFCPVKALARRVHHILVHATDPSTPLSFVGPSIHVSPRHILAAVRAAATTTRLTADHGYDVSRVGAHSLRASGAMALHLSGHTSAQIKKIGRWKSDAFLSYLHSQIAAFTHGTSERMATDRPFHKVGG